MKFSISVSLLGVILTSTSFADNRVGDEVTYHLEGGQTFKHTQIQYTSIQDQTQVIKSIAPAQVVVTQTHVDYAPIPRPSVSDGDINLKGDDMGANDVIANCQTKYSGYVRVMRMQQGDLIKVCVFVTPIQGDVGGAGIHGHYTGELTQYITNTDIVPLGLVKSVELRKFDIWDVYYETTLTHYKKAQ